MRIKHYTLLFAFLAIFMGIPLIQGCSDPFDEHGNRGSTQRNPERSISAVTLLMSMETEGRKYRPRMAGDLSPCPSRGLAFEIP